MFVQLCNCTLIIDAGWKFEATSDLAAGRECVISSRALHCKHDFVFFLFFLFPLRS